MWGYGIPVARAIGHRCTPFPTLTSGITRNHDSIGLIKLNKIALSAHTFRGMHEFQTGKVALQPKYGLPFDETIHKLEPLQVIEPISPQNATKVQAPKNGAYRSWEPKQFSRISDLSQPVQGHFEYIRELDYYRTDWSSAQI